MTREPGAGDWGLGDGDPTGGEWLTVLREAHAEEPDSAVYAAMRARVLAELRPKRRWGWVWAAVGVAAGLGAWGIAGRMRVQELPLRPIVAAAAPAPPQRVAAKARRRPVKTEEIVMKIETANSDVVIYWIAEAKGDE